MLVLRDAFSGWMSLFRMEATVPKFIRKTEHAVIHDQRAEQSALASSYDSGVNVTSSHGGHRRLRWQIIPSPYEWERASATSRFHILDRRSSPEMRAIDAGVAGYDRVALQQAPTGRVWEAAVALFEAIEVYLASPRGHQQKRVDAVNDLRAVTMKTLSGLRWKKYKEVTGGHQSGMRPMQRHYWPEMHTENHDRMSGDPNDPKQADEWLNDNGKERFLFQHLRKVRAESPDRADSVVYIEDSDRWKYQVVFSENGLAYERASATQGLVLSQSTAITTLGDNLSTAVYAVDKDGVFFAETSRHQGSTLNHCSYLGGRPVMCAGMIGITNGVVGYIDNGSGHYRPTVQNLLNCVQALRDQVSPMSFGAILLCNHAGPYRQAVYLAEKFLNTGGNCLPIGYYAYTGSGTHYRQSLVEFQSKQELADYIQSQDGKQATAKIERDLKELLARLERSKPREGLSGKLESDRDRQVLQAALDSRLMAVSSLEIYWSNDQPMKDWVKRRTYGLNPLKA